ncbi:MAG: hypothetical protein RIB65_06500 [Ilumatobacter fluminis]|uniref:hypothetical protein n=1 Tax=Ilumatobacter fluminis TaxID=467091 RepID=UPI0032EBA20B
MRLTTRRILATTISAALLVTACSSGDDEADSTTTPAPTTTAAPQTTTAPETTTTTEAPPTTPAPTTTPTTEPAPTTTEPAPTTQPPPTTNPGDPDWVAITQELLDTLYELRADPDVDRIEEFCLGGENPCQEVQGNEITQLENEGWVVVGMQNPTVIRAELIDSTDGVPDIARQYVVQVEIEPEDLSEAAIVDADGTVISKIEADPDNPAEVLNMLLLKAGPDWRVLGISGPSE